MARAGVAAGADGMIVEIHPDPLHAWSDGEQSLNEKNYLQMMSEVEVMVDAMQKNQRLKQRNVTYLIRGKRSWKLFYQKKLTKLSYDAMP